MSCLQSAYRSWMSGSPVRDAVLHNLSVEVWCYWEVLGRVFVCYMLSLFLWGRISFQALLNVSHVFCAYTALLVSACTLRLSYLGGGGDVIFSAFVQLHSTCVGRSDSSWKPWAFSSCRADLLTCNIYVGNTGQQGERSSIHQRTFSCVV